MTRIQKSPTPHEALHSRYAEQGAYTDCYSTVIELPVSQAQFVEAFYTTWLFKLERWILEKWLKLPSTDGEARQLARGERQKFAAWRVEDRAPGQLLMCDFLGATRSWLMVSGVDEAATRLYFGSVVVPQTDPRTGQRKLGRNYRVLMGFHRIYSRALLRAARSRLASLSG